MHKTLLEQQRSERHEESFYGNDQCYVSLGTDGQLSLRVTGEYGVRPSNYSDFTVKNFDTFVLEYLRKAIASEMRTLFSCALKGSFQKQARAEIERLAGMDHFSSLIIDEVVSLILFYAEHKQKGLFFTTTEVRYSRKKPWYAFGGDIEVVEERIAIAGIPKDWEWLVGLIKEHGGQFEIIFRASCE